MAMMSETLYIVRAEGCCYAVAIDEADRVLAAVKVPDVFSMLTQAHPRKRAAALAAVQREGYELAPEAEA